MQRRKSDVRSCPILFEVDALGVGVFRPGAFFLALDQKVDGLGGFFFCGRGIGRQFFVQSAPADARKSETEHKDDADEQGAEGIERAQALNG